jgi:hypothetical protein
VLDCGYIVERNGLPVHYFESNIYSLKVITGLIRKKRYPLPTISLGFPSVSRICSCSVLDRPFRQDRVRWRREDNSYWTRTDKHMKSH